MREGRSIPRTVRAVAAALCSAWLLLAGPLAPPAHAAQASCEEVLIPLSDGTRLHGWVRHGADVGAGPTPVLWTMTPYTNTGCPGPGAIFDSEIAEQVSWVKVSYRGTGASEGEQDAWGPGDRADIQEVGDWIASQPWADGLVPTGASAEGAWITFALDHPAVKASVWLTSCADGFRGCVRSGGSLAGGGFILTAGELQGYAQGLGDRARNGTYGNPIPPAQLAATIINASPAFTEDYNGEFWDSRLGLEYLDGIDDPVMFTTDLYDYVPHGMYLAYERAPAKDAWLTVGYGHNDPPAVSTPGTRLYDLVVKDHIQSFIRHRVLDEHGGGKDARVRLMTNLGTPSGYKRAEVLVRDEKDWPLPETDWKRLYLGDGPSGSATSLNDGALTLDPDRAAGSDTAPLATVAGPKGELRTSLAIYDAAAQSREQEQELIKATHDDLSADEAAGLTYTTPPLAEDSELTGPLVLTLDATSTAPDFDWQVRLTDVHPDGRSSWVSDGQLRASLRRVDPERSGYNDEGDMTRPWLPMDEHEPVPIGEPVDYVIELAPTSNVFRAGDRIRLDIQPIAEGYVDSARTGGAGAIKVDLADSRLLVPFIPSRCQKGEPGVEGIEVPACGKELGFGQPGG